MMMSFRNMATGAAIAFALPLSAHAAPIVIDDFTTGFFSQSDGTGGGGVTVSQNGSMLGGTRTVFVEQISGTGNQTTVQVQSSSPFFDYASGVTAVGTTTVTYDEGGLGLDPALDLSGGGSNTGLFLDVFLIDKGLPNNAAFEVTVSIMDSAMQTASVLETFNDVVILTPVEFLFSAFLANNAAINLAEITKVQFTLSGGNAADAAILGFRADTNVIPLPGALPLFVTALGLMGFVSYRRKARVA